MRRLLSIIAIAILSSVMLAAQDREEVEGILSRLGDERVSLHYSCTIAGPDGVDITLEGTILAQHNCYFASGAGLAIYCDGQSRWTVDDECREIYIENAVGVKEFLTDPAGWLGSVSNLNLMDVTFTPASEDDGAFRFDTTGLGEDWTIVDLR